MRVLAIESSSNRSSLAVWESGYLMALNVFYSLRRQSGPLFSMTDRMLNQCGPPDRVVVGTGPGSYSGIRTAIAFGQGLSLALKIPLHGLSSILSLDISTNPFRVFGNARGNQAWVAEINERAFTVPPFLLTSQALPDWLANSSIAVFRVGLFPNFDHIPAAFPCASKLAELSALTDEANCSLEPLYLKEAHITH